MNKEMTFNEYAKYLNEKEKEVKKAVSEALGTLQVPIEYSSSVRVQIDLLDTTRIDGSFCELIVGNVTINVDMKF